LKFIRQIDGMRSELANVLWPLAVAQQIEPAKVLWTLAVAQQIERHLELFPSELFSSPSLFRQSFDDEADRYLAPE
jgi:hypothetical protein